MAGKRTATSDLNHDNWDEVEQPEEVGIFRTASKEELQRRVIRTGRRRIQAGAAKQENKSVFSGFSGFNKAPASSFDFLANLTNGGGSASSNGSSAEKKDTGSSVAMFGTPVASSTALFNTSPGADSGLNSGGLFGLNQSPAESKTTTGFGTPKASPTLVPSVSATTTFGVPQNTKPSTSESKEANMFGIPQVSGPLSVISKNISPVSESKSASTIFGISAKGASASVSTAPILFGIPSKASVSSEIPAFKLPSAKTTSATSGSMFITGSNAKANPKLALDSNSVTSSDNNNKVQYYSKLKGLNKAVSDWIKKHVNENPVCILTPIFKDYEKYLKDIDEEREIHENETQTGILVNSSENKNIEEEQKPIAKVVSMASSTSFFSGSNSTLSFSAISTAGFSQTSMAPPSATFSFGINTAAQATVVSTAPSTTATPFSFGIGKGFNLNSNINQKPQEQAPEKEAEEEDEPPKVEFTPIAEENSVFDKRCKIFFKKDNNFVDKGVGTLYIKTIENSSKHQLIVRANTSLGTVLLNFILSDSIPIQRMGKNNVMVVCIPTPETKPPPVPVLIRVKTGEEADEMLETLTKYKT